jgi:hypothetical protein
VPHSGPTVLPKAIPTAATCGMLVKRFTMNAAKATAGQMRLPKMSMAANATPAAGHTGDTFPLVKGTASPISPASKQAAKTQANSKIRRCLRRL